MLIGKYINKFYKKFALFFLIGVLALVAIDVFHLYVPEKLGEITEILISKEKDPALDIGRDCLIIGLEVAGVSALMCIGRIIWRYTIFYASTRIEEEMRNEMFEKASRLSQRYYHENKVGTVMAWFTTDIETINEFLGWGTIMLVDAFFLSVLVVVKMMILSWSMTLICLLPIVLIAVWAAFAEKLLIKVWTSRQEANDVLYDYSTESFSGIRVIKAFVKERQQEKKFRDIAKKCEKLGVKMAVANNALERCVDFLIYFIFALLLGVGAWFIYCGKTGQTIFGQKINLNAGNLVTFIAYFDTLIWPVIALGQVITMHGRAKASLKRISDFLDQEEEVVLADGNVLLTQCKGEITFNDFSFAYPGSQIKALSNITLQIKEGETVGIVGKIGCGKTTLVDCLLHLYNVEKGSILIDGKDLMDLKISSLRDAIAYVPQINFLFNDNVENNIKYGNQAADEEKIKEAAEFASVSSDVEEFPQKYQTVIGERGTTVSGGQKQRISMARAYIKDAPILIMDDSVSAVDVNTEKAILKNIEEKRKGKTTLLIASRVSTVSKLDKIIVLNEGKLEAFGSPEEVMAKSPTFAKMAMLQELENEEGIRRWTTKKI